MSITRRSAGGAALLLFQNNKLLLLSTCGKWSALRTETESFNVTSSFFINLGNGILPSHLMILYFNDAHKARTERANDR